MLSAQQKDLSRGILLLASFLVVLTSLFLPIFNGVSPMDFMDRLYNSISKGSVYYIDQLKTEDRKFNGADLSLSWHADTPDQLERMVRILSRSGADVSVNSMEISLKADLGDLLGHALNDADQMFYNRGEQVRSRYQADEKLVLYDWWKILKSAGRGLNREKRFEEAGFVNSVLTKAVECAYNYYRIEARDIVDQAELVVLSLLFYVLYTVWLGYAILFCLKGVGLKLEHD